MNIFFNADQIKKKGLYEIPRIKLPSHKVFVENWAKPNKPVIFTDVVDSWTARKRWTLDWFKEKHGNVEVPIQFSEVNTPSNEGETMRAYGIQSKMSLNEYIDSISRYDDSKVGYLSSFNIFNVVPSLRDDFDFPKFHKHDFLTSLSIWIGVGGSKVHCDFAHNLFAQLDGEKQMQLYNPSSILSKYPSRWSWYSCFCEMDFESFDPSSAEDEVLQTLEPDYCFTIRPGELLFLPYGWWHRVITEKPSISANQWWMDTKMLAKRAPYMPVDHLLRLKRKLM